jgi:hypothetical protein
MGSINQGIFTTRPSTFGRHNASQSQRLAPTEPFIYVLTSHIKVEGHRLLVIKANGGEKNSGDNPEKSFQDLRRQARRKSHYRKRDPICNSNGAGPFIDGHVGASFSVILLLQLV